MSTNSIADGSTTTNTSRFDPNFTKNVIAATGPKANPRVRKVIGNLIQHLHDFCRENEITVDEWLSAVDLINEAGKMSDDRRNEGQLVCDVLGIESLVDEITYKLATEAEDAPKEEPAPTKALVDDDTARRNAAADLHRPVGNWAVYDYYFTSAGRYNVVAWMGLMVFYSVLTRFPGEVIPIEFSAYAKVKKISGSSSGRAPSLFMVTRSMACT